MAWTNGLTDMVMPYMIQFLRDYTSKVDMLLHERKEAQVRKASRGAFLLCLPSAGDGTRVA